MSEISELHISIFLYIYIIYYGSASAELLRSFVQAAPFSLVCFVLSVFRLFVYKLMRLTMPLCVLSCAYCCCCVSVPSLTSTRCKVETLTMNSVPCVCTGLTLWPFLLALPPPPHPPPWPLTSVAKTCWPVMSGQGRVSSQPFDRTLK